jgi:hypothetical protein
MLSHSCWQTMYWCASVVLIIDNKDAYSCNALQLFLFYFPPVGISPADDDDHVRVLFGETTMKNNMVMWKNPWDEGGTIIEYRPCPHACHNYAAWRKTQLDCTPRILRLLQGAHPMGGRTTLSRHSQQCMPIYAVVLLEYKIHYASVYTSVRSASSKWWSFAFLDLPY